MPRKAKVSKEEALKVLEDFFPNFQSNRKDDWPAYTSKVYLQMSEAVNKKWTAHDWYANIRDDRRQILSETRKKFGLAEKILNNLSLDTTVDSDLEKEDDLDSSYNIDCTDRKSVNFNLFITKEEWDSIKPVEINGKRTNNTLRPNVWTNVISTAFYKQHRLQCAFVFKRADVSVSGKGDHFLKIHGKCISSKCKNRFFGYSDEEPGDGHLLIKVKTRDTTFGYHDQVVRPLNGIYRKEIGKEAAAEGCSNLRKKKARNFMKIGDTIPPFIPSLEVMRQAKMEHINKELGIQKTQGARDLIKDIEEISYQDPYLGSIQEISSLPAKVIYSTPMQLEIYKKYIKIMKTHSQISIDSSGSFVEKLKRPSGLNSGHIFLYCIVINFNNKSVSVNQMLSESQTTETIEYWLKLWTRNTAPKPKTIVCDYSRALLTACSNTFNEISLKRYVEDRFLSMTLSTYQPQKQSYTFLRIDVAHLVNLVCRWKCFKNLQHKAVRDFYIRCVTLMVDCQTLEQFKKIFSLTCFVALQSSVDATFIIDSQTVTVTQARKILEGLISQRTLQVWDTEEYFDSMIESRDEKLEQLNTCEKDSITEDSSSIGSFITGIIEKAGRTHPYRGLELNVLKLPEFVTKHLKFLAKEFPLWTGVALPFLVGHATSSYVEQIFDDLKNRVLAKFSRTVSIPKFIRIHLNDLLGGTMIMNSAITTFVMQRQPIPSPPEKKQYSNARDGEKIPRRPINIPTKEIASFEDHEESSPTGPVSSPSGNFKTRLNDLHLEHSYAMDAEDAKDICDADHVTSDEEKIPSMPINIPTKEIASFEDHEDSSPTGPVSSPSGNFKTRLNDLHLEHSYAMDAEDAKDICDADHFTSDEEKIPRIPINIPTKEIASFEDHEKSSPTGPVSSPSGNFKTRLNDLHLEHSYAMDAENAKDICDADHFTSEDWRSGGEEFSWNHPNLNYEFDEEISNTMDTCEPDHLSSEDWRKKAEIFPFLHSSCYDKEHEKNSVHKPANRPTFQAIVEPSGSTSKFFKSFPEVRNVNAKLIQHHNSTSQKSKKVKETFNFLQNGLLLGPVRMDEKSICVSNTCGFDSIAQILRTACFEVPNFAKFVKDTKELNAMMNFIHEFIDIGAKKGHLYEQRVRILSERYKPSLDINLSEMNVWRLDATDNLVSIWKYLFSSLPSFHRISACNDCQWTYVHNETTIVVNWKFLIPDGTTTKGIQRLREAIDYERPSAVRCPQCAGNCIVQKDFNDLIYVELDIRRSFDDCYRYKLKDFPTFIELDKTFRLVGVVGYQTGHFIGYCKRQNYWQKCNDLAKKALPCTLNESCKPHAAIYVRSED